MTAEKHFRSGAWFGSCDA